MDFALNESEALLKASVERFVRERHSFEARKRILASPEARDEIWRGFAELGLLGIGIEEEFGGTGGTFQDIAIVMEAFGRGLVCGPYLASVVIGSWLVGAAGSQDQKARLLPALADGGMKLALVHSEPGARYLLSHVDAATERHGDGYRLNGAKSGVLGGGEADVLLVSARTSGAVGDARGISLFLVDAKAQGVCVRAHDNFDDMRAAEIFLDDVDVEGAALLGEKGGALPFIEHAADRAIAALCWDAIGAMSALNEITLDYIRTRVQFGRPIGKFQVLQHRMVDMTIAAEQARSMAILATDRADSSDMRARAKDISAAKVAIGRFARIVGQGAVQLHGGMGLTMEYVASHYFKRLTAFELLFGDSAYHLARFGR